MIQKKYIFRWKNKNKEMILLVTIYNNKTLITKDMDKEALHEIFKSNKKRVFWLLASLLISIFAVISLIGGASFWYAALTFLYAIVCLFMWFKGDVFMVTKLYKSFQKIYGESAQVIKFYNEQIEIKTPLSILTKKYNQITRIIETQNLYLLMIKRQVIIIGKNGFTSGDINNFIPFIKGKCKNA